MFRVDERKKSFECAAPSSSTSELANELAALLELVSEFEAEAELVAAGVEILGVDE